MGREDDSGIHPLREIRLRVHGRLLRIARGQVRSGLAITHRFRDDQSLGHEAESLGIPDAEIGSASADGSPWPLELPAPNDAEVELFPVDEPVPCANEPRFAADVHLGRLARDLRLLGFDLAWRNDAAAEELLELCLAEDRILLTRDRSLLFRRELHPRTCSVIGASPDPRRCRAMLVLSPMHEDQVVEVALRFGLAERMRAFSRCSLCGEPLAAAEKAGILDFVPPKVAGRYDEFFRCTGCGKVYWKGDHFRNIDPFLGRVMARLVRRSDP
jgi:uncharacterized protein